jgi:bacterioferritin-associated ferredoxin
MSLPQSQPRPQPMVDRCICHGVSFADIRAWADDREDTTLDKVRAHWGCGRSCGMCRPYIQKVLETGDVRIPLMVPTC